VARVYLSITALARTMTSNPTEVCVPSTGPAHRLGTVRNDSNRCLLCWDDRQDKTGWILYAMPYRLLRRNDVHFRCDLVPGISISIETREIAA